MKRTYEENKDEKCRKRAKYYREQKVKMKDCEMHQERFEDEIEWGPIFPCSSCYRDLFFRSVVCVNEHFLEYLNSSNLSK